jgi:hypothetical protein
LSYSRRQEEDIFEGPIVMLSKGGKRAIDFYAKIRGCEIYFYPKPNSEKHKFMHSLVGVFITVKSAVQVDTTTYFPLKIEISR